jgi:hypothetical protein
MCALADAGVAFSAGVFSLGDSDYTLALHLASSVLAEPPFAPISQQTRQSLRERLASSSLLIICPLPFSTGNLALLQEALAARQLGLPVLLLRPEEVALSTEGEQALSARSTDRIAPGLPDDTAGESERLLQHLLAAGASLVGDISAVLAYIRGVPGAMPSI